MSGSSGSGYSGGPDSEVSCDALGFEAQLTSPRAAAVAQIGAGTVLDIEVVQMSGQVVVQVLHQGLLVGGLTGPDATRLRACIEAGHEYEAVVRAINGGQVRVRVAHR